MNERVIRGRIDRSGALVSADAPLLRLQQRAGAGLGNPLALPHLARLVALSQRLHRGNLWGFFNGPARSLR